MNPKLIWYKKGDKGGASEFRAEIETDGTYTIGRHDSNDIILDDPDALEVSRHHAELRVTGTGIVIADTNSRNGTYLNGERITDAMWHPGEVVEIGPYVFEQEMVGEARRGRPAPPPRRDLEEEESDGPKPTHFRDAKVSYAQLQSSGKITAEVDYLALGAGLGSFIWIDHLRCFGVPASQIRAIGINDKCYFKYKQLCEYSQIPVHERLRSNSISTPDNIWGFPG
ncbi:MAG: FHA domain-containing protein, partial [Alphaproteobacteria bacterium]